MRYSNGGWLTKHFFSEFLLTEDTKVSRKGIGDLTVRRLSRRIVHIGRLKCSRCIEKQNDFVDFSLKETKKRDILCTRESTTAIGALPIDPPSP